MTHGRRGVLGTVLAAVLLLSALGSDVIFAQQVEMSRGTVRTDTLWAQSLGTRKALTVYLPPSYLSSPLRRYPVLVYLHGLTGNERNWVDNGRLDRTLDSLVAAGLPEAIVVMPDGDDGWYTTWHELPDLTACRADTLRKEPAASYCVPWPHFDDYIARDVVAYVDGRYRTKADRRHRGIAGLSMGGYGAVTLALAYPDVFAAAASHSGVLSPRYLGPGPIADRQLEGPARYASNRSGLQQAAASLWPSLKPAFGSDTIGWGSRDPGQLVRRALRSRALLDMPAIRIDCGVDDRYIHQNRDFHQTLLQLGVSHEYAEYPGAHSWSYWSAHASESVQFLLARVAAP